MTIYLDDNVSNEKFEKIEKLAALQELYNSSYSGVNIEVERGESTYIDSKRGDYDYDNMQLFSKVTAITQE